MGSEMCIRDRLRRLLLSPVELMALNWCRLTDLNRYPFAYKATALPLELSRLIWRDDVESNHDKQVNSLP